MTDERIESIRERLRLATQGPYMDYDNVPGAHMVRQVGTGAIVAVVECRNMVEDWRERDANAALLANAPSDLTYLLDRLEAQERHRNALVADLNRANDLRFKAEASRDALLTAAKGLIAVIDIIDSGQTVIPFGQESATLDGAIDRLRALVPSELAPSQDSK